MSGSSRARTPFLFSPVVSHLFNTAQKRLFFWIASNLFSTPFSTEREKKQNKKLPWTRFQWDHYIYRTHSSVFVFIFKTFILPFFCLLAKRVVCVCFCKIIKLFASQIDSAAVARKMAVIWSLAIVSSRVRRPNGHKYLRRGKHKKMRARDFSNASRKNNSRHVV